MKNNTCPNCGAAMGCYPFGWHCDYCGTEVDRAGEVIFKVENPKIKVAQSKVFVDACFVKDSPQEVVKYAKMHSCHKLAQFLFENDCIDFDSVYDPATNQHIFRAKFRYVDKGEKL